MKNAQFKWEYGLVVLVLAVDVVCIVETNAAWGVISYSGVGVAFLLLGLVIGRQTWRQRSICGRSLTFASAAACAVLIAVSLTYTFKVVSFAVQCHRASSVQRVDKSENGENRRGADLTAIRAELAASDLWVDMGARPDRPKTHANTARIQLRTNQHISGKSYHDIHQTVDLPAWNILAATRQFVLGFLSQVGGELGHVLVTNLNDSAEIPAHIDIGELHASHSFGV
jgi:hypothetical protein